jgi:hypothetical protein
MLFPLLNVLCFVVIFTSATRFQTTKLTSYSGKSIPGRYIVQLKAGAPRTSKLGLSESTLRGVTHTWAESHVGFNGFAGTQFAIHPFTKLQFTVALLNTQETSLWRLYKISSNPLMSSASKKMELSQYSLK